jgi:cobalt-zinc-cadmium efflux system outer membrane protein
MKPYAVRLSASVGALLLVIFGLALPAHAQGSDSLRLEQVIRDVVLHNDRVAAARFMEKAATDKVGTSGAWDDPMIMVGVVNLPTSLDFKMDPMTMTMVGFSQNIPYAGQKGLQSKAAGAEAQVAVEDRRQMEVELAKAARVAFGDLLYRSKSYSDLKSQRELLEMVAASARSKLATDQGSQEEVLAAQAEEWRLETQLLEAEHLVDESRFNLNILRGLDVSSQVPPLAAPSPWELPLSPDPWLVAARTHYPPLQKLVRQSESYAFASDADRRMTWPMLGLSGSYGFRASTEMEKRDDMISFGATLSLPIFSGHQNSRMAEAMSAMRQSVDAEALQLGREVEARLRLLHMMALHLQQSVALYSDRIIPASQDAFQGALASYAANRIPFTSLLAYATAIYGDRIKMNQFSADLERVLAEIESYTRDPETLVQAPKE